MIYIMLGSIIGIRLRIYKDISLFLFSLIIMFLMYFLNEKLKNNIKNNIKTKKEYFLRKEIYLTDYIIKIGLIDILVFILSTVFFVIYINYFEFKYTKFKEKIFLQKENSITENLEKNVYIISKKEGEYNKIYTVYLINEKTIGEIYGSKKSKDINIGKTYKVKMNLKNLEDEFNPKGFSEKKYYLSKFKQFKAKGIEFKDNKLKIPIHIKVLGNIYKLKEKIYLNYAKYIKDTISLGITLGDKEILKKEVLEDFKRLNIYHILSVSGMHISILIFILSNFQKTFKTNNLFNYILEVINFIILLSFLALTAFSVSTIRAFFMFYLNKIFKTLNISVRFIDILSFVFILNVLINPYTIFFAGIYLSFLAVCAIKLTTYILKTNNICILILVINILIQPILIYFTNILSLNFLLGNILITSIATCIILLSNIFILVFLFSYFLKLLLLKAFSIKILLRSNISFDIFFNKAFNLVLNPIYSFISFFINTLNKLLLFFIKLLKPLTLDNIYIEHLSIFFYLIYYLLIYFIFKSIEIMKKKKEYLFLNLFNGDYY